MNAKARAMHLRCTHFVTPEGLGSGNRSCAHDLALIAKAILADSHDGPALTTGLASLFGDDAAPGVRDVLAYADGYDSTEQALLARAVVDLFQQLAHRLSGDRSRH
jgi:hypothetical protein